MAKRIEDYAMIGDCKTAALVSAHGAIEWLCLLRFDSPSCFGSLLGNEEHGYWRIAPEGAVTETKRRYIEGSLILQTMMKTDSGTVELTDFMPMGEENSHVVRTIRGVDGCVSMKLGLVVRLDYGPTVPSASRVGSRTLLIIAGPNSLVLRSPVDLLADEGESVTTFTVRESDTLSFTLSH